MNQENHNINQSLSRLEDSKKIFYQIAEEIGKNKDGNMVVGDPFHYVAICRSQELIESFVILIKGKKLTTAFSITRLHNRYIAKTTCFANRRR